MRPLILTSVVLLPALITAQSATADVAPKKNIVQTAVAAGKFKTLSAALTKAGLLEALSGKGPFTVFAPTDAAFAKLPKGTISELLKPKNKARLAAILTYHVVAGRVDSATALKAGAAKTLQGKGIAVSLLAGQLRINGAKVIANDVEASNGVIHIIDSVLLPPAPRKPVELTGPQKLHKVIGEAIAAAVPLFNDGQPAACAAIYRIAALSVLQFGGADLDRSSQRALRRALDSTSDSKDANESAWTLRRALDRTHEALRAKDQRASEKPTGRLPRNNRSAEQETRLTSVTSNQTRTRSLFDFASAGDENWRSVNDNVMGGVSKGGMLFDDSKQTATFKGALSRRNNGGFSTVRSRARDLGLAGYEGLTLRVRGDGRTYKLQARSGSHMWSGSFEKAFATRDGEWQEIAIPFVDMTRSFRGRRVRSEPITGAKIRSIGFSIADKDESPFALEIDSIVAYKSVPTESAGNSVNDIPRP